jgi:coenzyme F420-0:L-glutamate ligase/coenzyme F420-1:gamma-L-glutamate ligase
MRTDKRKMENDLHAFLRSRRSIRTFKTDSVSAEMIHRILETAICAPSAHNLQPWRFVVLTSAKVKSRLGDFITAKFRQDMIADGVTEPEIQIRIGHTKHRIGQAPIIIVLCRDMTIVKPQPDVIRAQAEALMEVQSVALAGLQLLLAAHAEGLGGSWICWPLFAPDEIRHALGLTPEWEPQGMFFLGYPAESPEMLARRSLQEVTRYL